MWDYNYASPTMARFRTTFFCIKILFRAFFRRSISQNYVCISGDNKCKINKITRANCRSCRYNKCIAVGMKEHLVDNNKKWKKTNQSKGHIEIDSDSNAYLQTSVNINEIVDVCFNEQHEKDLDNTKQNKVIPNQRKRKVSHLQIQVGINEKKHSSLCFTLEEEFRIHDLIAKREFMTDIFEKVKNSLDPKILEESVKVINSDIEKNRKISYGQKWWDFSLKSGQHIASSKFQDVFDEFRHVNQSTAFECHYRSFPALCTLFTAISEGTKNNSMIEQQKMLGCSDKTILRMKKHFPGLADMRGIGMEDQTIFVSPWAICYQDEEFFTQTVRRIGELISSDISLCSVYQAMVMCSYNTAGAGLAQDGEIKKVQNEMGVLLYRYLASKMGTDEASEKVSVLTSYVERLHRCGDILFNRMLWMGDGVEECTEVMETQIQIGNSQ